MSPNDILTDLKKKLIAHCQIINYNHFNSPQIALHFRPFPIMLIARFKKKEKLKGSFLENDLLFHSFGY